MSTSHIRSRLRHLWPRNRVDEDISPLEEDQIEARSLSFDGSPAVLDEDPSRLDGSGMFMNKQISSSSGVRAPVRRQNRAQWYRAKAAKSGYTLSDLRPPEYPQPPEYQPLISDTPPDDQMPGRLSRQPAGFAGISPEPFQYNSIKEGELRLITLLQAEDPFDSIQCLMTHSPAGENPGYATVSYTWGDPSPEVTIICNDREFMIPRHCASALQALRHKHKPITVWIDFLCINQQDLEERSTQVPQLGDIFRKARKTFAYVGHSDRDFSAHSSEINTEGWKTLLRRPWFNRTWVIQEVLFSSRITIVLGQNRLGWNELVALCVQRGLDFPPLMEMRDELIHDYGMREPKSSDPDPDSSSEEETADDILEALNTSSTVVGDSSESSAMKNKRHLLESSRSSKGSGQLSLNYSMLFEIMDRTKDFQCKDERDKLFALLPLFKKPIEAPLVPNYEKIKEHMYTDLSWFFISEGDPDCLKIANGFDYPSVPSWATERSKLPKRNFMLPRNQPNSGDREVWHAGYPTRAREWQITRQHQDAIEIRGRKVAPILQCSSRRELILDLSRFGINPGCMVYIRLESNFEKTFEAEPDRGKPDTILHYQVVPPVSDHGRPSLPPAISAVLESIRTVWEWRFIPVIGRETNVTFDTEMYNYSTWMQFQDFGQGLKAADAIETMLKEEYGAIRMDLMTDIHDFRLNNVFDSALTEVKRGRCYAAVEYQGVIIYGLVPDTVLLGDELCVLFGFPMPCLMRPLQSGRRLFLGECFFQPFMQGKMVEDLDWSKVGSEIPDCEMVDFCIE